MTKKVIIWSQRYSPARGVHMIAERECFEGDAQAWLKIFREDEPKVIFLASRRKPKV